jgi:chloramphenicol-sensitive protein RarD
LICGIAAYTSWGFIPLYFRLVAEVSPQIILCHRVAWSTLFLLVVVTIRREWSDVARVVKNRRNILLLSAGAVLIAANWLLFIFAVASRQILQASLGYFINPLLSVVLGLLFLGERLRARQWLAVTVAIAGVVNLAWRGSGLPWLALSLAGSFGFYGLVRKIVNIDSLHGLLVETSVLLLPALVLLSLPTARQLTSTQLGLLSLSGIITAVPLLFFGVALRRLKLSTIGFLQYIGPTLQFVVALCCGEALDRARLVSFALCWLAIVIYAVDSVLNRLPQILADEPE